MPDTTLDIAAARDLWKRLAPLGKRLIDAQPVSDLAEEKKKKDRHSLALLGLLFFWDSSRGRYITGAGKLVLPTGIKQSVNTFAGKVQNQLGAITGRLTDGDIGLPEYESAMMQKVAAAHVAGYAIGAGGIGNLEDTDVETAVGYHMDKLDGFIRDIKRGGLSPEAAVARARLYGASVSPTYEVAYGGVFKRIADTGVRVTVQNVLGQAEHCSSLGAEVGCLDETSRGFVALNEMSLPGQRRCGPNCKCRLDYRIEQE